MTTFLHLLILAALVYLIWREKSVMITLPATPPPPVQAGPDWVDERTETYPPITLLVTDRKGQLVMERVIHSATIPPEVAWNNKLYAKSSVSAAGVTYTEVV